MAIIFENTDNNIQYIKPENIVTIKTSDKTQSTIRYMLADTGNNTVCDFEVITLSTAEDILKQLNQQHYKFIDINTIVKYPKNTCYVNQNAIESIRTTNSSNSKYNKNALFEIKTNLQHNNIVITVDNAVPYKLRQFIKSLETKK